MIKNVFIFTLMQLYVRGKNIISEGEGGIYRPLYVDYCTVESRNYRYGKTFYNL